MQEARCGFPDLQESPSVELSGSSLNPVALGFDTGCIMQEQLISSHLLGFKPKTNGCGAYLTPQSRIQLPGSPSIPQYPPVINLAGPHPSLIALLNVLRKKYEAESL